MGLNSTRSHKHLQVFEFLLAAINRGEYQAGDQLPVDAELAQQFGASRPTVARALSELQNRGLVERRVGSGTFVRVTAKMSQQTELIGLLIPDTGSTEIFDAIVRQIKRETQRLGHGLLLGDLGDVGNAGLTANEKGRCAEAASARLIAQGATGVLFAPVEFTSDGGVANQHVLAKLNQAGIPVVLIDRDVGEFDRRSSHDLVSVDHIRAGFFLARHLLALGRRRIAFLAREYSAGTSLLRRSGVREAILQAGAEFPVQAGRYGRPEDRDFVQTFFSEIQPDAIICSNDDTAAQLMRTLETLSISVPDDIAIVGIDNVHYADLLRVPLTTISQPCEAIGQVAVQTLLSRINNPNSPLVTITLEPTLVIRQSCGTQSTVRQ
ncbi:LacI family DNA-binding transcriptional regulator [Planctomicrobium piriforme]|uniref:DNA-binding transcriptional regulator, LacI/PurR family n=1 Tax=Planctomicrobium piriforme TaxID=1576369 RepID=A0A1I3LQP6_9PLAN|nr:GntR family transcriptional regulator [Planctomicrobium piriforme]SFI87047.1 DNA-binding transcriptional regulator, LacI/PurR family [Planctomicrobium piriforme]